MNNSKKVYFCLKNGYNQNIGGKDITNDQYGKRHRQKTY